MKTVPNIFHKVM